MPTFLHVGCGPERQYATTREFDSSDWVEIRLDIDPGVKPDVVSSMTQMDAVETGSMDAVFSSRNLEHLHPHEVPMALSEFARVLKPEGYLVITCLDIQEISTWIAEDKLMHTAYTSAAGPIRPLDMIFGLQKALARGDMHMAHRCGFTQSVLVASLKSSGFSTVASMRRPNMFDLWALACKSPLAAEHLNGLATSHFPLPLKPPGKALAVEMDAS
jgi:predicted SAM-dependent methyltransferase